MKIIIFTLLLLLCSPVFAGPLVTLTTNTQVDSYIQKSGYNGVILVAKEKNILMKKAYGDTTLNNENGRPLVLSDKFEIGSITKQFVAASLLKLQEEGKISLDDEITKYLPYNSAYNSVLKNIRIRDLLNHSSGVANYTDQEKFWDMVEYSRVLTLDEIIDFILPLPFDFEVRTQWKYSNSGYILAGKILEIVSNESWDQYIKNHFLIPLGMTDTGTTTYFENVSQAVGHMMQNGTLVPFTAFNLSWAQSAGALYSTVDDLLKWMAIYDETDLLSASSKKEMQTPFLRDYALGIGVKPFKDERMISHGGRTPGFVSNVTYLDKTKLSIICLDNIDGSVAGIGDVLLLYFTEGKAQAIKLDDYAMTENQLNQFVGAYECDTLKIKLLIQNGTLYLLPDGQRAYKMRPNDVDSFDLERFAAEEFFRNESGAVTGFTHYQGRTTSTCKKVADMTDKNLTWPIQAIKSEQRPWLNEINSFEQDLKF